MVSHRIQLLNTEIAYVLRRSPRRRSIGLRIDPSGLIISVPAHLSQHEWERALQQKSTWILSKLDEMRQRAVPPVDWQTGLALPFLGSPIELAVEPGSARALPVLTEGVLHVPMSSLHGPDELAARVTKWYKQEALAFFQARVASYARQLDVGVSLLTLSNARTRWGSCTSTGAIRLNWRLIKAPPPVIDYVVAHELAHRIELNHSPAFWKIVSQLCPDHRELRTYLKTHSAHYHQF